MGLAFEIFLILYTAFFFLFVYTFVIANPRTSRLAQIFQNVLPHYLIERIERLFGAKCSNKIVQVHDYLLFEQNPVLLVVYISLVVGSWSIVFCYGFPMIIRSPHVSDWHCLSGILTCILCFKSWYPAYHTGPGYITASNITKFDNYAYDNAMFIDGSTCPTLKIRKVARSKFDRFTSKHVARFDHYCGWINQPIGEENYRYFLLFLLAHLFMCWYGTILFTRLLQGEAIDLNLYKSKFLNAKTNEVMPATTMVVIHFLLHRYFFIVSVLLLMAAMAILLTVFLLFHVYITTFGMTTNEFYKWRNIRSWHTKAVKYYQEAKQKGEPVSTCKDKSISWNFSYGSLHYHSTTSSTTTEQSTSHNKTTTTSETKSSSTTTNTTTTVTTVSLPAKDVIFIQEGDNDQVIILHPGDLPKNVYNRGFVENWREVIFPRSLRNDALTRYRQVHQKREEEQDQKSLLVKKEE